MILGKKLFRDIGIQGFFPDFWGTCICPELNGILSNIFKDARFWRPPFQGLTFLKWAASQKIIESANVQAELHLCFQMSLTGQQSLKFWAAAQQNQQNDLCTQQRLRSAWAFTQSDQSSLSEWRSIGSLATQKAHSKDWSDWVGWMLRLICLCCAHRSFCWFSHAVAQICGQKLVVSAKYIFNTFKACTCRSAYSRDFNLSGFSKWKLRKKKFHLSLQFYFIFCWIHFGCLWKHFSHLMTKPTMWLCAQVDSDQSGHLPNLIRVFAVRWMGS